MAVKHQTHFCPHISNKEMEVGNMEVKRAPASDCFVRVFFNFLTYHIYIVFICSLSVKTDDAGSITFEFCSFHSVLTSPRSWANLIQGLEMFTFTSMSSLYFWSLFHLRLELWVSKHQHNIFSQYNSLSSPKSNHRSFAMSDMVLQIG